MFQRMTPRKCSSVHYDYRPGYCTFLRPEARRFRRCPMTMMRLMALVLMSTTLNAFRLGAAAVAAGTTTELTAAQLQADFDLMRHALEEAHPGLYRYSTKAQMDRQFDAERAKLSRPMNKSQFEVVIAQTLA